MRAAATRSGQAVPVHQTSPAAAMTARVVVDGLAPDARHWYRFVLDGHVTAPARTASPRCSRVTRSTTCRAA